MRGFLVLTWLLVSAPHPAPAGAWMREPGSAFLAATVATRSDPDLPRATSTLYGELGLSRMVTLGIDINEHTDLAGHVLGFLRVPLRRNRGPWVLALELAAGADHFGRDWAPMQRLTLSAGRGLETPWGSGWVAVDAAYEHRTSLERQIYKLDATFGLSSGPKLRPLLQIETSHIRGQPLYWTVTPSVMFNWREVTWLMGVERKSIQSGVGLKLGMWQSF